MAIKKTAGRIAMVEAGSCTPIFDHIAVWAADTEASARFLVNVMGWKRHPTVIRVSDEEKTTGGMIGTFFDAPGLWIELIEPTTPGPGQDILDQLGDGALVEINFDLGDDYGLALQKLADCGVEMLSMDGSPLKDGGTIDEGVLEGDEIQNPGQRIAYFPISLTHGTTVEYYEVLPEDHGSLIHERDRVWANEGRSPDTPYVDYVAIVTDNAEKAADFFVGYMGLERIVGTIQEDGNQVILIDANGADDTKLWLKLVQPGETGRAAEILAARGAGHIMELGVVCDIANVQRRATRLGAELVDDEGNTLRSEKTVDGTKAYLRQKDSCGIPICLVPRSVIGR